MVRHSLPHCVKSVCIRSYSGSHFPAFGLNTERHIVSLCIQSKCGKIRTRITPNSHNDCCWRTYYKDSHIRVLLKKIRVNASVAMSLKNVGGFYCNSYFRIRSFFSWIQKLSDDIILFQKDSWKLLFQDFKHVRLCDR